MPKNRSTIYSVVRTQAEEFQESFVYVNPVVLGTYLTAERADEIKGKYIQEMKDRNMADFFEFEVQASTFYDE